VSALDEPVAKSYVLHKQHLLNGSKAGTVTQVVRDIVALHTTSAETPYLSLFARMRRFRNEQLDKELYGNRSLIRLSAMRGTLFISTVESSPILFMATKSSELRLSKWIRRWGVRASEAEEVTTELIDILKGRAKTLPEIKRSLPRDMIRSLELRVGNDVYRMTNVNMVLNALISNGRVISEKAPSSLRVTQPNRYYLIEEAYPNLKLESINPEEARMRLITHYIKAFGPVLADDIAWWTGFNKTEVKNSLASSENELISVEIKGSERDYIMLKTDYAQCSGFEHWKNNSVALLPYEDPYPKGYKVRDKLVEAEHEKKVYVGGGAQPTILLNGNIVGVWSRSVELGRGKIELRFFSRPTKGEEKDVVLKARAVARLMTTRDADIRLRVES